MHLYLYLSPPPPLLIFCVYTIFYPFLIPVPRARITTILKRREYKNNFCFAKS
uniref:Uncharacterized protein n=1 Tax=Arundo donax TaxID=35708 RepID=A0A0A8ZD87_ARUDO